MFELTLDGLDKAVRHLMKIIRNPEPGILSDLKESAGSAVE
jgi:hypothetical protein